MSKKNLTKHQKTWLYYYIQLFTINPVNDKVVAREGVFFPPAIPKEHKYTNVVTIVLQNKEYNTIDADIINKYVTPMVKWNWGWLRIEGIVKQRLNKPSSVH